MMCFVVKIYMNGICYLVKCWVNHIWFGSDILLIFHENYLKIDVIYFLFTSFIAYFICGLSAIYLK